MLIGHKTAIKDLKRLADERKLVHGYVFFGPRMVGKRTLALNLANYLEGNGFSLPKLLIDATVIEPDENGTIGIDAIRDLKQFLWQRPNLSLYRTAIINDAELLTTEAQNALLRIAEEPPPSTLLILITSDPGGLAPTLSSRLQKIYFSTVPQELIEGWLIKELSQDKKTARNIAARSFGKPGLAAAIISDKKFQELLKSAENLLKLPAAKRRDFLKKLLIKDDFSFTKFLDALIIHISSVSIHNAEKIKEWHNLLRLRHEAAYFNLNPRLQLEALFMRNNY